MEFLASTLSLRPRTFAYLRIPVVDSSSMLLRHSRHHVPASHSMNLLAVDWHSLLLKLGLAQVGVAPAPVLGHLTADAEVSVQHADGVGGASGLSLVLLLLLLMLLLLLLELGVLPIGGRRGETAAGHGRHAAVLAVGRHGAVADRLDLLVEPREVARDAGAREAGSAGAGARGHGRRLAHPRAVPDGCRGEVGALRHRRHFAAPPTVQHRCAGPARAHGTFRSDGGPHAAVALGAVGPVAVPAQVSAGGVGHPTVSNRGEASWSSHSCPAGTSAVAGAAPDTHLLYAPVDLSEVVGGRHGKRADGDVPTRVVLHLEAVEVGAVVGREAHGYVVVRSHPDGGGNGHL